MIDLRSDTVSQPTSAMKQAMIEAPLGDDAYGDDPTVNRLEATVAELLGKQAAVFVTSGTQGNLCAILAHCGRGDQYLVGRRAHNFVFEAGGATVLGGLTAQPIDMLADGTMRLEDIAQSITTDSYAHHFAVSKLLCLENTKDGIVLPQTYVADAQRLARIRGLAVHLDGARLWNAATELNVAPDQIARGFDTVSVCLSKGLGAPAGSLVAGSTELVEEARRWRKMLGGSLRQAGMLAAAGLYGIEHHLPRMAEDHDNARYLANGLAELERVTATSQNTNMVFIELDIDDTATFDHQMKAAGINVRPGKNPRLVTHVGITRDHIDQTIATFDRLLNSQPAR